MNLKVNDRFYLFTKLIGFGLPVIIIGPGPSSRNTKLTTKIFLPPSLTCFFILFFNCCIKNLYENNSLIDAYGPHQWPPIKDPTRRIQPFAFQFQLSFSLLFFFLILQNKHHDSVRVAALAGFTFHGSRAFFRSLYG